MRIIRHFEEFLSAEIAKTIRPDINRARSLIKQSKKKIMSLKENLEKVGIKEINANDYLEHIHDILLLLVMAEMYIGGYSSLGNRAHEAEVAYFRNMGFEENDVILLDQLRYFRNSILYYGASYSKDEAEKILYFMNKVYPKLNKLVSASLDSNKSSNRNIK